MRNSFVTGILLLSFSLSGQGIRDSLFQIKQVEITSQTNFQKEEAGMKSVRIDTFLLKKLFTSSLSELLAENTSIYIKDYGRGALASASFRGTAPSHTQVSWNGININSPMLGMVDFSLIPVYIIDELTIQHGAASIASQSGGLGGLIQMGTLPDWNNKASGKFYQSLGSFHSGNLYGQYNFGNRKFQSKSRIYYNTSKNNYVFLNKNIIEKDTVTGQLYHPSQENKNAEYTKYGLSQEFYWRPKERSILSNKTWVQVADRSIPTVLSSEYSEEILMRENIQTDQTIKNVTEYIEYWQNGSIRAMSGLDLQQLDYSFLQQIAGLENRKNVNSQSDMINWYNQVHMKYDFTEKISGEMKTSYHRYDIVTFDSAALRGYDTLRNEISFFGGAYYSPIRKIQFSLQLRKDIVSGQSSPLVYAIGMNWNPINEREIIVKANFSKNYHLPSLNDLYWQPGGNPNLLPEEGYSEELSILYSNDNSRIKINTSLTGYLSNISNWILWLPGFKGYWEPLNIDKVHSYGFEYQLSMRYTIKNTHLRFSGNFAMNNIMSMPDDGPYTGSSHAVQLPFIPRFSGNASFSLQNQGYYVSWQNNSMGPRTLLSSNITGLEDHSAEIINNPDESHMHSLYPHYLNKLTIGKEFAPTFGKFTLELKIDNLFNETYRNVLNRFMPGRSCYLLIKLDF